jgi:hypothetical protein
MNNERTIKFYLQFLSQTIGDRENDIQTNDDND